jgi:hypothetical protein
MTDDNTPSTEELSRTKVNLETAQIAWTELQRFFANGSLIYVADELDLVDVAIAVANDDQASVEKWMQANQVATVSDKQAKAWQAKDAILWAVVVRPFVLVQENTLQ